MQTIQFPDFMAVTFGLVTYLLGEAVNDRVGLLRRLSIPDPVTGGLIVAAVFYALHAFGLVEIGFDTHARDLLLLIFFTGIGLSLFGRLSRPEVLGVVLLVWVLQIAWSRPWLERFRYGPFEWLWRSLARWQRQPMKPPAYQ